MAFIAAGTLKRARLNHPTGDVRATQRLLRQSVFDFLADFIINASILDLFAGTGAFGIEALSRGAHKVIFVDISSKAVEAVKGNLISLGLREKSVVYQEDALKYLVKSARKFRTYDIIFLDPPFSKLRAMKKDEYEDYMIELIARSHDLLAEKSIVIVKYPKKLTLPLPSGVTLVETKDYGQNRVAFIAQTEYINSIETAHDPGTAP